MKQDKWIWMPHAGHFICGPQCQFHLATYVGKYIVSTIGEYKPDNVIRSIIRQKAEFDEMGLERLYETMVFKAKKSVEKEYQCCPFTMVSPELDFSGYNDPSSAYRGHLELCRKWSRKDTK